MSGPVDVLANLASMAVAHGEKWEQIHDAVVELIEADKEYDAAREQVDGLRDGVSTVGDVVHAEARLHRARTRRAAALARVGAA